MLKYLKDIMSVLLSKKYFIKFSSYEKKKEKYLCTKYFNANKYLMIFKYTQCVIITQNFVFHSFWDDYIFGVQIFYVFFYLSVSTYYYYYYYFMLNWINCYYSLLFLFLVSFNLAKHVLNNYAK